MGIYDCKFLERCLKGVERGDVVDITWAAYGIDVLFCNARAALDKGRAVESDKAVINQAASAAQRLAVAVNALIDKQLKERQDD